MNFNEILSNIIMPVICALISGGLTVFGVSLTIRYENKKNKESIRLSYKPFLCRIDPNQDFDYKNAIQYYFNYNSKPQGQVIEGIFKNTDNGLLILDSVFINDEQYYPNYGNVVDKNTIFYLYIYCNKILKEDDKIILNIKDVFNNEYKYDIKFEVSEKSDIISVTSIKEI